MGTLRNWRAMKIGPSFVKIGKAVLYPIEELEAWDECSAVLQSDSTSTLVIGRDDHRQALWTYPTPRHQPSTKSQKNN